MDPILLTVLFKGLGMLGAIGGGIFIARYGFQLYRDGAGSGRDQAAFEVGPVKAKAHSVGSVIMASAFMWAWAGVALSPNLDRRGDEWKISSFRGGELSVDSFPVAASLPKTYGAIKNNPEELKKVFAFALANSDVSKMGFVLNGKPASYDPRSIRALQLDAGHYLVTTNISAGDKTATLAFEPQMEKAGVIFIPFGFGKVLAGDKK